MKTDFSKMKIWNDYIFVFISTEQDNTLYSKTIRINDGTECQLFLTVPPTDDKDIRRASFHHTTGVVVGVGEDIDFVKVGDIAIMSSNVTASSNNLFEENEDGKVFYMKGLTTYVQGNEWAYANRGSVGYDHMGRQTVTAGCDRDRLISRKGEYNEMSSFLGFIRGERLIANAPYVFLEHEKTLIDKTTIGGIQFQEKEEVLTRKVMAVSDTTTKHLKYIRNGDTVLCYDMDCFDVKVNGMKVTCINDIDIIGRINKKESI